MSLGRTRCVALAGVTGAVVDVEADIVVGLPAFAIGGLPDTACRQSADRIKAAAVNSALSIPTRRITVNLSPASLPKAGSHFDLAIAVAVLVAAEEIPAGAVDTVVHLGEVGLDGALRPVRGVLPLVLAAVRAGFTRVVVAAANAREAALVTGVDVVPATTLRQVVDHHRARHTGGEVEDVDIPGESAPRPRRERDIQEVVGQTDARLALEIAAAGGHHLFMVGPPGAGKTMLAECLPSLLPDLTDDAALEVTAVHSVLGLLEGGELVRRPPFVAPHHGASTPAVVGGGTGLVRPGLISRAHHGVLFCDEAPEFRGEVLQSLRQPLESGTVTVARWREVTRFPARFQLVLAANPCPCGKGHGKGLECSCTPKARRDYLGRLAGPLLDRVDLQLQVRAVTRAALTHDEREDSATVAARVRQAREIQRERLAGTPWTLNAHTPGPALREPARRLPRATTSDLDRALDRGVLTLRGYDRVLRLAWTVRDIAGGGTPTREDIGLALMLRSQAGMAA